VPTGLGLDCSLSARVTLAASCCRRVCTVGSGIATGGLCLIAVYRAGHDQALAPLGRQCQVPRGVVARGGGTRPPKGLCGSAWAGALSGPLSNRWSGVFTISGSGRRPMPSTRCNGQHGGAVISAARRPGTGTRVRQAMIRTFEITDQRCHGDLGDTTSLDTEHLAIYCLVRLASDPTTTEGNPGGGPGRTGRTTGKLAPFQRDRAGEITAQARQATNSSPHRETESALICARVTSYLGARKETN